LPQARINAGDIKIFEILPAKIEQHRSLCTRGIDNAAAVGLVVIAFITLATSRLDLNERDKHKLGLGFMFAVVLEQCQFVICGDRFVRIKGGGVFNSVLVDFNRHATI